jgi:hypothetical protein
LGQAELWSPKEEGPFTDMVDAEAVTACSGGGKRKFGLERERERERLMWRLRRIFQSSLDATKKGIHFPIFIHSLHQTIIFDISLTLCIVFKSNIW